MSTRSLRAASRWTPATTQLRPGRRSTVVCNSIFEQFTEQSIKAVMLSQHEAKALGNTEAVPVHLLLGLLSQGPRDCAAMLGGNATLDRARKAVQTQTGSHRREILGSTEVVFSPEAKRVFESAQKEAARQRQKYVSPLHLLQAILSCGNADLQSVLTTLAVDVRAAKAAAQAKLDGEKEAEGVKQVAFAGSAGSSSKKSGGKTYRNALDNFCRDLCDEARQGRLDPVVGRDKEVVRVTQILARRRKNNPVLLGEPGTGKTAIAEGLAISIVRGRDHRGQDIPAFLRPKRVLQLDVGLLISGSKERGELEKRVTSILNECQQAGNVILVIDEIHTIVGTGAVGRTSGAAGSGLDLGNLLKPALARGRLQVVGATTLKEHRQHFEKDAALERRFQPVLVAEPSSLDALDILKGLQERYEKHHNCIFSPQALVAAVSLSERYVPDRFLPDKAIDLMDEAGSRARIAAYTARKSSGAPPVGLEAGASLELQQVMEAKTVCIQEGLWEEAELLRSRELELKQRLSSPSLDLPSVAPSMPIVGAGDVADIVASWTGIPVSQLSQDDCWKLLNLAANLKEVVIGQDAAVDSLSHAITRARSGLADPSRPVASLMFQGPTGVGKTELARSLAKLYFGSDTALVRLDMSEYGERHSVSKLVGAPPGFMGYGAQGGVLTEAVRRHPHCLVLLDEVEKAHPDVFNILLQVLEDGRLTDSSGRVASFKHSLIVMTTNLGGGSGRKSMAFDLHNGEEDREQERVRAAVTEELKAYFRPEFLNRLDEIIIFRTLRMEEVRLIADLMLSQTSARLLEVRGFSLQISGRLMSHLLESGYDEEYGARPLRRAITSLIEDPLADAILGGRLARGQVAYLDFDGTSVSVAVKHHRGPDVVLKSGIVARPKYGAVKRVKEEVKINA